MFLTPVLVRAAPHLRAGERLLAPLERLIGVRSIDEADDGKHLSNHVVLVGYGVAGRMVAKAMAASGIEYVVLELNAENVRDARGAGERVYYGDATSEEALGHAHLTQARALVILINDPSAVDRVVDTARRVAPSVQVLIRTHYLAQRGRLLALGAREVVAEEVEGGLEILARILRWLGVPRNTIDQRIEEARTATQQTERNEKIPRPLLGEEKALQELKIESIVLGPSSRAVGRSAVDLDLRRQTGALIVAVWRGDRLLEEPDPHVPFEVGDIVYLVGGLDSIRGAMTSLLDEG
jgi:CPA2 family monovalent cation:H+ antiporter-2